MLVFSIYVWSKYVLESWTQIKTKLDGIEAGGDQKSKKISMIFDVLKDKWTNLLKWIEYILDSLLS